MQNNLHSLPIEPGPIGVFDSGYGGLTILSQMTALMPQYDYLYLGDNARAPYGTRSYEVVYDFTRQAVIRLFELGCHLVILACNTASAKALRTIQQCDLPLVDSSRRVLGVVRPTTESVGNMTKTRHVGVLATPGTVFSRTYEMEMNKLYPDIHIASVACPLWVPLVENGEHDKPGTDYFVRQGINELLTLDPKVDTIILGCTHYPLLLPKLRKYTPSDITLVPQGNYVAHSLQDYLRRHPDMDARLTRYGTVRYLTTERPDHFCVSATIFLNHSIEAEHITLS